MRRPLLRTLAALAGVAAPLLLGSPASADPEDGQGCIGLQNTPSAYVCLIALDPTAIPGVQQTGTTTLFDDNVCYLAGCRHVTVTAPTLGLVMPTSPVLVVYYNGTYTSVGLASMPTPPPTGGYVATVTNLVNVGSRVVFNVVDNLTDDVEGIDVGHWFDCTVESETNDQIDPSPSSSYSGYSVESCTMLYLR